MRFILISFLFISLQAPALAEANWSDEQQAVIDRMQQLGQSVKVDGGGGEAYGKILASDFSRWTVGTSLINHREVWLKGITDWYESGWRVTDATMTVLEVDIHGDIAATRRIVRESYLGPNGENQIYESGVVEVWTRSSESGLWMLLRASVTPKEIKAE